MVVSSLVAVNPLVVVSPLVTVNPLVVVFEPFGGSAKVVVKLKNPGGCNLKSRQILRTSGGNPETLWW